MYPDKLNRHFTTKHADLASKSKDYFKRLLSMQNNRANYFESAVKISDKAQVASYKIAESIPV